MLSNSIFNLLNRVTKRGFSFLRKTSVFLFLDLFNLVAQIMCPQNRYFDLKPALDQSLLLQNLVTSDNPIPMWLRLIWNSAFWLAVKNLKIYWENDKMHENMYRMQEVIKCYLFLIFVHFLWTYPLRSKHIHWGPTIKIPFMFYLHKCKYLISILERI